MPRSSCSVIRHQRSRLFWPRADPDQFVIDLVAAAKNVAMIPKYDGLCW